MGTMIDVGEAETLLSKLLERVRHGEEIVITESGRPVAKLSPIADRPSHRQPGSARGRIAMTEEFDAPLPDGVFDTRS